MLSVLEVLIVKKLIWAGLGVGLLFLYRREAKKRDTQPLQPPMSHVEKVNSQPIRKGSS